MKLLLLFFFIWGWESPVPQQNEDPVRILYEHFLRPPEVSGIPWTGSLHHFVADSAKGMRMLRLSGNSTRSDTSWLAAPLDMVHGIWEFEIDLRMEPSHANRLDVVLAASRTELNLPFNGYAIKAGDNGSDDVLRLVRFDEGRLVNLASGNISIAGGGHFKIRVERNTNGRWQFWAAVHGEEFQLQAEATDNRYTHLPWTGFRAIYTRNRNEHIAVGPIAVYRHTPALLDSEDLSPFTYQLTFDTPLDTLQKPQLWIDDDSFQPEFRWQSNIQALLQIPSEHLGGSSVIHLSGLQTRDQLQTNVSIQFPVEIVHPAKKGDIRISEYMYHPPEGVGQFVELINVSNKNILLSGWELRDFSAGTRLITSKKVWLPPDSMIVITSDSAAIAQYYGYNYSLEMPRFPSLNRGSRDGIIVLSPDGERIDSIAYSPSSAGDGVSIERVHLQTGSEFPENWQPSNARKGATPGLPNTAEPPNAVPAIESHTPERPNRLRIRFRGSMKPIERASIISNAQWMELRSPTADSLIIYHDPPFLPGISYQWTFTGLEDIFGRSMADTTITVMMPEKTIPALTSAMEIPGQKIQLRFRGEVHISAETSVQFGPANLYTIPSYTSTAMKSFVIDVPADLPDDKDIHITISKLKSSDGDFIPDQTALLHRLIPEGKFQISEIMFNPLQNRYDQRGDQSQYLEVLNTASTTASLQNMKITNRSPSGNTTSIAFSIPDSVGLGPGKLAVFTADTADIPRSRVVRFFGITDTRSLFRINRSTLGLNTTEGHVILWQHETKHDSLHYGNHLHQPAVRDQRGVSLERISMKVPSSDMRNWVSHAGVLGGSPLQPNSNPSPPIAKSGMLLSASPIPFSPDGDGRDEILHITVNTGSPGWMLKLNIYDKNGRHVRTLATGERIPGTHTVFWNGQDDRGNLLPSGLYILLAELWHLENANRKSERLPVGLIHQSLTEKPFK